MAKKVIGTARQWSRRWRLVASALVIVGSALLVIQQVLAVHDTGAFQLDGDATQSLVTVNTNPPTTPGDDWDRVCYENAVKAVADGGKGLTPADAAALCGTNVKTQAPRFPSGTGATAVSWSTDDIVGNGPSLNATLFTGGGSKDPQNINQWAWKDGAGGLPDKDNLIHAFAARYSLQANANCHNILTGTGIDATKPCEVLYFGSDRYDNSGDAQQGFWFLQSPVGVSYDNNGVQTPCPQTIGGGTGFCDPTSPTGAAAVHTPGDVLVLSDFSNGGTTSTISIFKWDPTCTATNKSTTGTDTACADANLRTLFSAANAKCDANLQDNDPGCGIVNPSTLALPWPFLDKSGTPNNQVINGEFFEAGINLSTLGLGGECFSSVVAETRSSTSTTATLKDFVVGRLGKCGSSLVTTPKVNGTTIGASGVSIGTGVVSNLTDSATVTVSGIDTWAGTVKFFICSLNTSPCATGGTQVGAAAGVAVSSANPTVSSAAITVSSVGTYCWRGEFTSTTQGVPSSKDASAGECFTVVPVTPTLITSATGPVPLGTAITDTATLSGTATQPGTPVISGPAGAAAGGSITFRLYGPFASLADSNLATCNAGTPVFTSSAVPVSGNATYGPVSATPTVAGFYKWIATYSGNSPNTNGTAGTCASDNENSEVIQLQPQMGTAQFFYPNDSAHVIVASGGGALAGSVSFSAYTNNACSGTALFTQTRNIQTDALTGGTNFDRTVETTNITARVNAASGPPPAVYWVVSYTSTNSGHKNITGTCGQESTTLTITDLALPTP